MNMTISDYPNFAQRLTHLGYRYPNGLALLPLNIESVDTAGEVRQLAEAATVRTLFRQEGITIEDVFDPGQRPPYVQNNSIDWLAPTIFVGAGVLSENPNTVSIALGVLANYLTDFFKGRGDAPTIRACIVVEQRAAGPFKRIQYEGPVEGLQGLAAVVKELQSGPPNP